jgi:hypothetical protein
MGKRETKGKKSDREIEKEREKERRRYPHKAEDRARK